MNNILLKLMFIGTDFSGFQIQKNAVSIQGILENAIKTITGEYTNVCGCSRTDKGVHANEYYANFKINTNIDTEKFVYSLNAFLPKSIAVSKAELVPADFNARYNSIKKEYIYKIYNGKTRNPFYEDLSYRYYLHLDEEKMNCGAKQFIGKKDFKSFMSAGSKIIDTTREVYIADVKRDGDLVTFRVQANGYLYNMVRIMVGTLIWLNDGKIEVDDIPKIIESKNRQNAGPTASSTGLFLNKVFYE